MRHKLKTNISYSNPDFNTLISGFIIQKNLKIEDETRFIQGASKKRL